MIRGVERHPETGQGAWTVPHKLERGWAGGDAISSLKAIRLESARLLGVDPKRGEQPSLMAGGPGRLEECDPMLRRCECVLSRRCGDRR